MLAARRAPALSAQLGRGGVGACERTRTCSWQRAAAEDPSAKTNRSTAPAHSTPTAAPSCARPRRKKSRLTRQPLPCFDDPPGMPTISAGQPRRSISRSQYVHILFFSIIPHRAYFFWARRCDRALAGATSLSPSDARGKRVGRGDPHARNRRRAVATVLATVAGRCQGASPAAAACSRR